MRKPLTSLLLDSFPAAVECSVPSPSEPSHLVSVLRKASSHLSKGLIEQLEIDALDRASERA